MGKKILRSHSDKYGWKDRLALEEIFGSPETRKNMEVYLSRLRYIFSTQTVNDRNLDSEPHDMVAWRVSVTKFPSQAKNYIFTRFSEFAVSLFHSCALAALSLLL